MDIKFFFFFFYADFFFLLLVLYRKMQDYKRLSLSSLASSSLLSSSSSSSTLLSSSSMIMNIGNVLVSHIFSFLTLVEYFQLSHSNTYLMKISKLQTSKPDTIILSGTPVLKQAITNPVINGHFYLPQQIIDLQPRHLTIDSKVHVNSISLLTRLESLNVYELIHESKDELISLDGCSRLRSLELEERQNVVFTNASQITKLIGFFMDVSLQHYPNLVTFQNFYPSRSLIYPNSNLTSLHIVSENIFKEQQLIQLFIDLPAIRVLHLGNIEFTDSKFVVPLREKYGLGLETFQAIVMSSSTNLCKILEPCPILIHLYLIRRTSNIPLVHNLLPMSSRLTTLELSSYFEPEEYFMLSNFLSLTALHVSTESTLHSLEFLAPLTKLTSLSVHAEDYAKSTLAKSTLHLPNFPSIQHLKLRINPIKEIMEMRHHFLLVEELELEYMSKVTFEQLATIVLDHLRLRKLYLFGNWQCKLKKKKLTERQEFLFQFLMKLPQLRQFFMELPYRRYEHTSRAIAQVMKHRRHFFLAFTEQSQKEIWDKYIT